MRVRLIQVTQNPIDVMWTAARTCYSAKSPVEIWDEIYYPSEEWQKLTEEIYKQQTEKHWNLVKKVLDSGHQSVAEHVYFTFAIEGISRACSHQLVRHRAGIVFSQQSQRYCVPKDREVVDEFLTLYMKNQKDLIKEKDLLNILIGIRSDDEKWDYFCDDFAKYYYEKYFVIDNVKTEDETINNSLKEQYTKALYTYIHLMSLGLKGEDARNVLPNATKTNITMSVNFRELIHLCNLRLCTRAQLEIRNLFKEIVKCVKEVDERLVSYLVPSCEVHGICFEGKCCGRKPQISDVMNNYNAMRSLIKVKEADDALSADDFELLKESMKNPQFNEKLAKFLKEPTVFDDYNDICKELQELRENMQQNSWERDENA